jgi:hypothetical protein
MVHAAARRLEAPGGTRRALPCVMTVTFPSRATTLRRLPAAHARIEILAQHEVLRGLLRSATALAELALNRDRPGAAEALPRTLDETRDTLEQHLAFEEDLLWPLLCDDLPLGPLRARHLAEQHARQRDELTELAALARPGAAAPADLVDRLRRFCADFLADMNEEERALMTADLGRDEGRFARTG